MLPGRPSLRRLKLEAKRRLAAGEFPALHRAQLALAREHGFASWAALKRAVADQQPEGHALAQVRWLAARFADAGGQGWAPPDEGELRQHFDDSFLAGTPPAELTGTLLGVAAGFREELAVIADTPLSAQVQVAGARIVVRVAAEPPHRVTGARRFVLGGRVGDPPVHARGRVPPAAAQTAKTAFAGFGLAGLALAGDGAHGPAWAAARGWSDLERAEPLTGGHRFPVHSITMLVTATTVLRLVAQGQIPRCWPAAAPRAPSSSAREATRRSGS